MNTYQVMFKGFNWFRVEAVDQLAAIKVAEKALSAWGRELDFSDYSDCDVVLCGNKTKKRNTSLHAEVTNAIRQELKLVFPVVKFSVKCKKYTSRSTIYVFWENGPSMDEVELVVRKYHYGYYNGMEDLYEDINRRDEIPRVETHQSLSRGVAMAG